MMTIDQKLRDASSAISRAASDADYSVAVPGSRPALKKPMIVVLGAAALLLVVGLPAILVTGGGTQEGRDVGSGSGDVPATTAVAPSESDLEESLIGNDTAEPMAEDTPGIATEIPEPSDNDWVALTNGVSFAWVAESATDNRLWVRSTVADPMPASSTDTLSIFVPVNADITALLINAAYEHPDSVEAVLSDGTVVSLVVSWDNSDIGVAFIPSPFDPFSDTVTWLP